MAAHLSGRYLRWRGALVDEVSAEVSLRDHLLTLSELRLALARGVLTLTGEADFGKRSGHLEFYSNLDFTSLSRAFSPHVATALSRLDFGELPLFNGRLDADWGAEGGVTGSPRVNLQADVDWEDFSYGGAPFRRLVIPIAFYGNRLFIPEAVLEAGNGVLRVDALYDRSKPEMRARIDSTLDVTAFEGVVGPAVDRFLESLHFNGAAPHVACTIAGTGNDPRDWLISGHGKAVDCSYKKIDFDSAEADFAFQNLAVDLRNFVAHRKEGSVTGGFRDDFALHRARIDGLTASVDIQAVAPALGDKFAGYVAPYLFDKPAKIKVSGVVDLDATKPHLDTDLSIDVDGSGGNGAEAGSTLHYVLYKFPLLIERPKAHIRIVDRNLTLRCDDADLFDGKLSGNLKVSLETPPKIDASFQLANGDFSKAMRLVDKEPQSSGVLNLQVNLAGSLGDLTSFKGDGGFSVDNGYILAIPFLGGLSNVLPGFGQSKADHGKCSFQIANGILHTDDLTISSVAFSFIGNGNADFARDQLDMDVRINIKGILGLILFPVSKLFEYHGSGSLEKPVWNSKNL